MGHKSGVFLGAGKLVSRGGYVVCSHPFFHLWKALFPGKNQGPFTVFQSTFLKGLFWGGTPLILVSTRTRFRKGLWGPNTQTRWSFPKRPLCVLERARQICATNRGICGPGYYRGEPFS